MGTRYNFHVHVENHEQSDGTSVKFLLLLDEESEATLLLL